MIFITKYGTSSYADGVFKFALVYYSENKVYVNGYETFTLTGKASASSKRAKANGKTSVLKPRNIKANHRMLKKVSSLNYVGR